MDIQRVTNINKNQIFSESSWLDELRYGRPHEVASSNSNWDEFLLVGKKIPLAVLAARVRGVFPRPGEAVLLLLNKKTVGFVYPPGRVFFPT